MGGRSPTWKTDPRMWERAGGIGATVFWDCCCLGNKYAPIWEGRLEKPPLKESIQIPQISLKRWLGTEALISVPEPKDHRRGCVCVCVVVVIMNRTESF